MDSLDVVNRKSLGNARRHSNTPIHPALTRYNSSSNYSASNHQDTSANFASSDDEGGPNKDNACNSHIHISDKNNNSSSLLSTPLAKLEVADSQFLGFARSGVMSLTEITEFIKLIKAEHPHATHIPYAWMIPEPVASVTAEETKIVRHDHADEIKSPLHHPPAHDSSSGWDEDGEPEGSTAPFLLEQVKNSRHERDGAWLFPEEAGGVESDPNHSGTVVVIVRYFGSQLLGVTCGRLSQCYQRVAQLTLHRLFRGCHVPQQLDFTRANKPTTHLYGLGAGDTELHMNVVPEDRESLMSLLLQELDFGGFKGAAGEVLPRLQNLQADFYEYDATTDAPILSTAGSIIPVYRYPGNYQGDEWATFSWSPSSLQVREKVEAALPHFYNGQKMNHCVTNYYRKADDFIAHHGDKDLDLDRNAAIVSVSVGSERILELRRRAEPRDLTRLVLPHGSMLLLGPITNQQFTHSILPAVPDTEDDDSDPDADKTPNQVFDKYARISLTLRHVVTYMDTSTRRLFGQGVECATLRDLRRSRRLETIYFGLSFGFLQKSVLHYLSEHPIGLVDAFRPTQRLGSSTSTRSDRDASSTTASSNKFRSSMQERIVFLGSISGVLISAAAWWSYSRMVRWYHKNREESEAREFFTKASTSGTKY